MRLRNSILLAALACVTFSSKDASATSVDVYGNVVSGFNSTTTITPLGQDNMLEFFIPISYSASGTYGQNGVGQTGDYGFGGGFVNMGFYFGLTNAEAASLTNVTLQVTGRDIDLEGGNELYGNGLDTDPDNTWIEHVRFFGRNGFSTSVINAIGENVPNFYTVSGDFTNQYITFSNISQFISGAADDPFILGVEFYSLLNPLRFGLNTSEAVSLHLTGTASVPEPMTVSLLAGGLAVGAVRRRRKAQAE